MAINVKDIYPSDRNHGGNLVWKWARHTLFIKNLRIRELSCYTEIQKITCPYKSLTKLNF